MTAGAVLAPTVIPLRIPIPGKLKQTIDTATPIELHCETPQTAIYYTVDGSKPDPFAWVGCSKRTNKYKNPIYLEAGKQIVKAVAIDLLKNRESPIVTKTFYVEKTNSPSVHQRVGFSDNDKAEGQNSKQSDFGNEQDSTADRSETRKNSDANILSHHEHSNTTISDNSSQLEDEEQSQKSDSQEKTNHEVHSSDSEEPSEHSDKLNYENTARNDGDPEFEDLIVVPENTFLENKIETTFCDCKHEDLNDMGLHFCSICGKIVKQDLKCVVPSSAQMGICPCCHCHVPMNTPYCVICETRFLVKNHLFIGFKENKICQNCFSINPMENDFCTLCEKNLPNETQFVVPKPEIETAFLPTVIQELSENSNCEECGRLNSRTARYCDWCGNSLEWTVDRSLTCPSCYTTSKISAHFCHSCGLHFQPPINKELMLLLQSKKIDKEVEAKPVISFSSVQTDSLKEGITKNQISQTSLSSNMFPHLLKTMHKLKTDTFTDTPSRSLYTISPERGFWRQQVNHVIAHLKAFTYNDLNFRNELSQLRLMQLIKGNIQQSRESITIQLTFSVKHDNNISAKSNVDASLNKENINVMRPLSREEQIWEAVAKNGDISKVNLLLSEKVYLRDRDKDGNTIIHVAMDNGRADLIESLYNAGADLYARNSDGQPPLHQAILLQEEGLSSVKVLLDLGVDVNTKNRQGKTAYELAIATDNEAALNLFSAQLGKDMMNQLIKTKSAIH